MTKDPARGSECALQAVFPVPGSRERERCIADMDGYRRFFAAVSSGNTLLRSCQLSQSCQLVTASCCSSDTSGCCLPFFPARIRGALLLQRKEKVPALLSFTKKQLLKIQNLHKKIAHQRKDFIDKEASCLAKSYDVIVVEDIDLRAMGRVPVLMGTSPACGAVLKRGPNAVVKIRKEGKRIFIEYMTD